MSPIVNQEALVAFIEGADLDEARRAEAALEAMAASVHLRVVELESELRRLDPNRHGWN